MKRLFMAVAAVFMLSSAAMAQDSTKQEHKKFDKTEMIQKRTDKMVQQYGLSKDQATKLLELNTEYAEEMPGHTGLHKNFHKDGKACACSGKCCCADSACSMKCGKDSTAMTQAKQARVAKMKARMEARKTRMEDMKANMTEYNTKLKGIMTDEQYTKYQDNIKKFAARGQRWNKAGASK